MSPASNSAPALPATPDAITQDVNGRHFFDRRFLPGQVDDLLLGMRDWLYSPQVEWLVRNVPGRPAPNRPLGSLRWPPQGDFGLDTTFDATGRVEILRSIRAFAQIADWRANGTAWDFRSDCERPDPGRPETGLDPQLTAAILRRASELGLRSHGRLPRGGNRVMVSLGGARKAPWNRVRAMRQAIAADLAQGRAAPAHIVLLTGWRALGPSEHRHPEVITYAPGARFELDLMLGAGTRLFGIDPAQPDRDIGATGGAPPPVGGPGSWRWMTWHKHNCRGGKSAVHVVQAPSSDGQRRATTADTLTFLGGLLGGPISLVTSPTCRPFQYLDAARVLGLDHGVEVDVIAHPAEWAQTTTQPNAAVYLQEIRSTIQASLRLVDGLTSDAD